MRRLMRAGWESKNPSEETQRGVRRRLLSYEEGTPAVGRLEPQGTPSSVQDNKGCLIYLVHLLTDTAYACCVLRDTPGSKRQPV